MGTSQNYSLPWPEPTDTQMAFPALAKTLAEKVDTELKNLDAKNLTQDSQMGVMGGTISDLAVSLNLVDSEKVDGPGLTLRRDTSVGERILLDRTGGSTMLYGDTGWRNVSGLLENGWTGAPLIRRTGSLVTLVVRNSPGRLDGSGATGSPFLTLPGGFQIASHNYSRVGYLGSGTLTENNLVTVYQEDLNRIASGARVSEISGILSWQTSNSWPTTLPGLPL